MVRFIKLVVTVSVALLSITPLSYAKIDTENGYFMTLEECIAMALRQNETIENAYLDRIVQKSALKNAEHTFNPQGSVSFGPSWTKRHTPTSTTEGGTANITTTLNQKLKTGGNLGLSWTKTNSLDGKKLRKSTFSDSLSLTFNQPLLKGGGLTMGTLSLRRAYLTEESNILSLKTTLMTQIQSVITRYCSYANAVENIKIQRSSFERELKRLEQQDALVKAGRLAPNELVKTRASIAQTELRLIEAENTVDDARIDLLRLLNMDTTIPLLPVIDLKVEAPNLPNLEDALKILYANDPAYLGDLISLRNAELSLKEAKDGLLWDLSLNAGLSSNSATKKTIGLATYDMSRFRNKTWSAGVSLTIPINDRSSKHLYLSAKIAMRKTRVSFQNKLDTYRANITKQLRTIENNYKRVQFAEESTRLSRLDLEIAGIRYDSGQITNFEFVQTQDTLVQQELNELNAKITYLNDLIELDKRLGTLLDTLGIDINRRAAQSKRIRERSGMPPPIID